MTPTPAVARAPRTVDGRRILVTAHAVERFVERVRPGLDAAQARGELERILCTAEVGSRAPAWLAERAVAEGPIYVVVDDVVLPAVPTASGDIRVVTCFARGCWIDDARRRRNARRQDRRQQARARRYGAVRQALESVPDAA
jgi:hypothetical protein